MACSYLRFPERRARMGFVLLVVLLGGCPAGDDPREPSNPPSADAGDATVSRDADTSPMPPDSSGPPSPSHTGLISVQDVAIANLPSAGHGLSVQALFTAFRAPDYEEKPGAPDGCKVWSYDLERESGPVLEDHGRIELSGIHGGPIACVFEEGLGYHCPTADGSAHITVRVHDGGMASYEVSDATFDSIDLGRYLRVAGAEAGIHAGAFPIVSVLTPTTVMLANPRAVEGEFDGEYRVLAGAGPVPGDLYTPFAPDSMIRVALISGEERAFADTDVEFTPGDAFVLDTTSLATLTRFPIADQPLTLSCEGEGGTCGEASATLVRLTTTDATIESPPPTAMPTPIRRLVEIACANLGRPSLTIPAEAMAFLVEAHRASPTTRIRAAYMRDELQLSQNPPPATPNRLVIAAGRGILGFTDVPPPAETVAP